MSIQNLEVARTRKFSLFLTKMEISGLKQWTWRRICNFTLLNTINFVCRHCVHDDWRHVTHGSEKGTLLSWNSKQHDPQTFISFPCSSESAAGMQAVPGRCCSHSRFVSYLSSSEFCLHQSFYRAASEHGLCFLHVSTLFLFHTICSISILVKKI